MVVSAPIALDKRRAMLNYDALQEIEQQFHVVIAGTAGSAAGYGTIALDFEVDFFDAPEQRDSSLFVPHFTFGAFIEGASLMVSASVRSWDIDSRGAIVGAEVAVGVCNPGVGTPVAYSGYIHLTFQGYGALIENDAALDVGT